MDALDIQNLYASDNQLPHKSRDYLFIVDLLRHWQPHDKYLTVFRDQQTGRDFCLREDKQGDYHHPRGNVPVTLASGWTQRQRIRGRVITHRFIKRFYILRVCLTGRFHTDQTLLFDYGSPERRKQLLKGGQVLVESDLGVESCQPGCGLGIFADGQRIEENWNVLNDALKWSLLDQDDPIIDQLRATLRACSDTPGTGSGHLCPLDGWVTPIQAHLVSPGWTWQSLCGREYVLQICPYCLFQFDSRLAYRS